MSKNRFNCPLNGVVFLKRPEVKNCVATFVAASRMELEVLGGGEAFATGLTCRLTRIQTPKANNCWGRED
jgi:hypothetical protein